MKDIKYLQSILDYDSITGILRWKKKQSRKTVIGYIAGTNEPHGYLVITIKAKTYKVHRIVWMLHTGKIIPKQMEIDHINGIRNDNRIVNLRLVTRTENSTNASKRKDNKSGVTGVTWTNRTNKWRARITVNKKEIELGSFTHLNDAIKVRKQAEKSAKHFHENHGKDAVYIYTDNIK